MKNRNSAPIEPLEVEPIAEPIVNPIVEPIAEPTVEILTEKPLVSPKNIVLYSRAFGAQISKLLKSTRPKGLVFDNGVAIVTKEELEECKKSEYWGKSISDKKFTDQKPPVRVTTDKEK